MSNYGSTVPESEKIKYNAMEVMKELQMLRKTVRDLSGTTSMDQVVRTKMIKEINNLKEEIILLKAAVHGRDKTGDSDRSPNGRPYVHSGQF